MGFFLSLSNNAPLLSLLNYCAEKCYFPPPRFRKPLKAIEFRENFRTKNSNNKRFTKLNFSPTHQIREWSPPNNSIKWSNYRTYSIRRAHAEQTELTFCRPKTTTTCQCWNGHWTGSASLSMEALSSWGLTWARGIQKHANVVVHLGRNKSLQANSYNIDRG